MLSLTKFGLRFLGKVLFFIFTLSWSMQLFAAEVRLSWGANTDSDLAGYKIYYGTASRSYDTAVYVGNTTAYTLSGLSPGTYYFAATAYDTSGNESRFSNEAVLTLRPSDATGQPAKPSSQAIFISSVVEGSQFRANLGINNLSPTVANVSVALVDKRGIVMGSKTVRVNPRGFQQIDSVALFLAEAKLGREIQGSLYLESDQPIFAWLSEIENTTNDPSLLASKRTGTTWIMIPSVANTFSFTSSLALMNVGASTAFVALKAYSVAGSLLGQSLAPLSIPPAGSLWFENVLQMFGVTNNYGPLEITSLNNVPLVASSRVSNAANLGGTFKGFDSAEASMIQTIPTVLDTLQLRTNLGINNPSEQPASVMIRLISRDGLEVGATAVMVMPKGLTQINNVVRRLLNQSEFTSFEGYLRLESDQPIFGWASIIDNLTNDPGFVSSQSVGSTRVLIESATNRGSFKSSLVVVNMGDTEAAAEIVAYDNAGQVSGELRTLTIPARGCFTSDDILQHLGITNSFGPIEIISTNGQPVIATSRVYSTSGTGGFFEGVRIE
jgi:hypothetical protein